MNLFVELSIILVIAAVVAGIAKLLKQPLIMSYILTGLIVGGSGLHLLENPETLGLFAEFGIALLLFIIGLGLNPKVIKEVGKVAAISGLGQVVITFIFGFGISQLLGFDGQSSFYISAALTLSSTIIILKIISDKSEAHRLYAKIATGILLVQDLVATGLLIYVAAAGGGQVSIASLSGMIGWSAVLATSLALSAIYILPKFTKFIASSQEFLFLFTIAFAIGVASLFEVAGLSIEVGALFAGVALANQTYAQEVASRLRPLRDFFIVIFFVLLGATLQLDSVGGVIIPVILLSLFVMIGNPLIVMTITGLLGYTKRTSFKAGIAMAQISEFSLVFIVLANELKQVNSEVVALVTLVGIITIAGSTYLMQYDEKLYELFEKYLSLFERREIRYVQKPDVKTDILLFGYAKGGQEFVKTFKKLGKSYTVVDYDPEAADHLIDNKIPFVYGDMTDVEFLGELGLDSAKVVVSTVTNPASNLFITRYVRSKNNRAVIIVHSENPKDAVRLYEEGATYVMMPHYIGSERVGHMLRKNGLKKSDFTPARERHMRYVEKHL
jgi:Kef-type K+ transport system membrane component KefB